MAVTRAGVLTFLGGVATGVVSSALVAIFGAAVDWWRWHTGPEDSVRLEAPQSARPFFELTLYSISDGACDPAAKEETGRACSVLLDFDPDEIRNFVTERVPFYSTGTHREILESFLDQNTGCLDWTSRWTMDGRLYTIRGAEEMRRSDDGKLVCPRQVAQARP